LEFIGLSISVLTWNGGGGGGGGGAGGGGGGGGSKRHLLLKVCSRDLGRENGT
jgi:hypothetical protein